jgi:hypothetical protein
VLAVEEEDEEVLAVGGGEERLQQPGSISSASKLWLVDGEAAFSHECYIVDRDGVRRR